MKKNEEYTLKNISIEIYKKEEKEENVQNETSKIETINILLKNVFIIWL